MTLNEQRPQVYRRRAKVVTAYLLGPSEHDMTGLQVWLYELGIQSLPSPEYLLIITPKRPLYVLPGQVVVQDAGDITLWTVEDFEREFDTHTTIPIRYL